MLFRSGGNTASFIEGPVKWTLPSNNAASVDFIFPVGKNATYLPFTLNNPVTGVTAPLITVEAFDSQAPNPSKVDKLTVFNLSSTEHWKASATGNFTGSRVSVTRQTSVPASSVIARSEDGGDFADYVSIGGTVSGNSINTSNNTNSNLGTFAIATQCPATDFTYGGTSRI